MKGARLALVVFAAALVLRLGLQVALPLPPIAGDAVDYDHLATSMLDGQGYVSAPGVPTAKRPPGYALFVAGTYATLGHSQRAVAAVQALLDAATCVLVLVLARRMFGDPAALVATAFTLFSFAGASATRFLVSETLATFLFVAALLVTHLGLSRDCARRGLVLVGAGVLWGLGTLTKGTFLPYPLLVVVVALAATPREWATVARRWALVLAGFGVVLAPWTIRNLRVMHAFIPVAMQSGQVIYSSWVPPEGHIMGVYSQDATSQRILALPEVEQSHAFVEAAKAHVLAHLGEVPRLVVLKLVNIVVPLDWELLPQHGTAVLNPSYALSLPFFLVGAWLLRRRDWSRWLLYVVGAGLVVMTVVTYGSPRLRLPLEPTMYLVAGLGVVELWRLAGESRRRLLLAATGAYATLLLVGLVWGDALRAAGKAALRAAHIW